MKEIRVKVYRNGKIPEYKTDGAACLDCYARLDVGEDIIPFNSRKRIPLGFAIELPEGYEAVIRPRSGMTAQGIDEAIGTIDCDYRGEVCACLINNSGIPFIVRNGDRICQLKIQKAETFKLVEADELSETVRGSNGFGSTGM